MYPLNMINSGLGGYAVANNEKEHRALSDKGYQPAFVESEKPIASKKQGEKEGE